MSYSLKRLGFTCLLSRLIVCSFLRPRPLRPPPLRRRASLVQPSEVKWQLMVTSCYRRLGDYHKALELYQAIHEAHPDNIEALQYLEALCRDLSRPTEEYSRKLEKLRRALPNPAATQGERPLSAPPHKPVSPEDITRLTLPSDSPAPAPLSLPPLPAALSRWHDARHRGRSRLKKAPPRPAGSRGAPSGGLPAGPRHEQVTPRRAQGRRRASAARAYEPEGQERRRRRLRRHRRHWPPRLDS